MDDYREYRVSRTIEFILPVDGDESADPAALAERWMDMLFYWVTEADVTPDEFTIEEL